MLKIYNAYSSGREFRLDDYLYFEDKTIDTGYKGKDTLCRIDRGTSEGSVVNYDLTDLQEYIEYLNSIKITDENAYNIAMLNPASYRSLLEKSKDVPETLEAYEENGLNEEAILLFTQNIGTKNYDNNLAKKIIGGSRSDAGLFLLQPNATITLVHYGLFSEREKDFEVLQSRKLGKRLVLAEMGRKI